MLYLKKVHSFFKIIYFKETNLKIYKYISSNVKIMLLKRQENENIIKALYDSSNVLGSIYDNLTGDLKIIFKSGLTYKYPGVSKSDYLRLEIAESQGVVFNSHIKKYSFIKDEPIDPANIIKEADDLKNKEQIALLEAKRIKLLAYFNTLIQTSNGDAFIKQLKTLRPEIDDYINEVEKTI